MSQKFFLKLDMYLQIQRSALEEVRLCLTKDFKFRDCVTGSDCPEYVSLPEFAFSDDLNGTKIADQSFTGHESF
ncbi:unnamed protein product [Lactuca virosa]|uniref:Uncharacterized protein n=1 Tax=Lactuca virosa TaxID=75947 RepID=A0AAU9PA81_9ASTR|nr:unnamed protein product [Lactuca virosa]